MMKKLWWIWLLIGAFLFRNQLMSLAGYDQEGISTAALLIAGIGGIFVAAGAYAIVTGLEMRAVSQVTSLIIGSGLLFQWMGHRLGQFPAIGEFWGGFIAGAFETCVLNGAVYGAKEVWEAKKS